MSSDLKVKKIKSEKRSNHWVVKELLRNGLSNQWRKWGKRDLSNESSKNRGNQWNEETLNYRWRPRLSNRSISRNGSNQSQDNLLKNEQVQQNNEKDQSTSLLEVTHMLLLHRLSLVKQSQIRKMTKQTLWELFQAHQQETIHQVQRKDPKFENVQAV